MACVIVASSGTRQYAIAKNHEVRDVRGAVVLAERDTSELEAAVYLKQQLLWR